MLISSRAHGNMMCKKTTKAWLAAKAGKRKSWRKWRNNKAQTRQQDSQQGRNNVFVDAQLSQYNKNNDKEEESSKNAKGNPMKGETMIAEKPTEAPENPTKQMTNHMQQVRREKTNYGLLVEVAMEEAQ
eukprot:179458-Ditylum_brightwellii.AAC.1